MCSKLIVINGGQKMIISVVIGRRTLVLNSVNGPLNISIRPVPAS